MHAITVKTQLAKVDFLQYTSATMQRGGFGKAIDKLKCIEMKYWETEKSGTKTDKEFRKNRLSWIGKELKKRKQSQQEDAMTIIGNRAPYVKVEPYFWELSILLNIRL